jgi:hypothetical protein
MANSKEMFESICKSRQVVYMLIAFNSGRVVCKIEQVHDDWLFILVMGCDHVCKDPGYLDPSIRTMVMMKDIVAVQFPHL